MNRHRPLHCLLAAACFALAGPTALAQSPSPASGVTRIVVPYPPGGPVDTMARLLSPRLQEALGRNVIVENRPGASTIIGTEVVARANPDGHTLLMVTSSITINPSVFRKLPYDTLKDLVPVAMVSNAPFILVVHPSLPARTVREFLALAKRQPGQLTYGSSGIGSANHLAGALLSMTAGVETTHIPYKGTSQVFADLIGGHSHFFLTNPITVMPHLRAGKLRALGVTGSKRIAAAPEVPTIAEAALPGFESTNWIGAFTRAGAPAELVQRISAALHKGLDVPDLRDRLAAEGNLPPAPTPEQFAARVRADVEKWAKVVQAAGIKSE